MAAGRPETVKEGQGRPDMGSVHPISGSAIQWPTGQTRSDHATQSSESIDGWTVI